MAQKVAWFNDTDVSKTLLLNEKLELGKTLQWFEKASRDDSRRDFVIETAEAEPIGIIGLVGIDSVNQTAEIYLVIGEKEYWAKGVMLEAESLLIKWAFDELGLHKIWALARADNIASIITMKKMGFQVEGALRQEKYISDKHLDVLRVGLLKDEFKNHSSPKEA